MTPATQTLIAKLTKSARNLANASNRAQREAAQAYLIKRAEELVARRDALEAKLGKQWDWLDANPDDERYDRRELQALELLHDYEAVCDALDAAKREWLHDESEAA